MSAESIEQLEGILDEAVRRVGVERERFISEMCVGDRGLRETVDTLLPHYDFVARSEEHQPRGLGFTLVRSSAPMPAGASLQPDEHDDSEPALPFRLDQYDVVEEIGRGSMGVVYRAVQMVSGRSFAVKVIRPRMKNAAGLAAFRLEVRRLRTLRHPCIARIVYADMRGKAFGGRPYFVMEFVKGVPITIHARDHGLSIRDRLALFSKTCNAVAYAHRNNTFHCDLKPENTVVDSRGRPFLLDFGVAQADRSYAEFVKDGEGIVGATPAYASPEQIRDPGKGATAQSDVFALGLIGIELFTDRRAVRQRDHVPVIVDRLSIYELLGVADPWNFDFRLRLSRILSRAVAFDPTSRYMDAEELYVAVKCLLRRFPISAEGAWRASWRNRVRAWLGLEQGE
ncbi:MAG: serine/threonine protein kinase [Phycisphaerales bacterium]|nr:serine/threonine protein kinase [Phycisphaerales bacterium]